MIHPTAVIHPKAEIDSSVIVGPYAVIDAGVTIGPRCEVGPNVYLTGQTTVGAENRFHAGAVVGDAPQDLKYKGAPSRLRIGDRNTFREHVTVNRATTAEEDTVVGSNNFLMGNCHVGHNTCIGNDIIIANGALLGGHVRVGDRALISGNCLVHQFVRVGTLALMQGGSAISKDLPPFTIARGDNGICGLNVIGLRRAGVSAEDRLELKRLYRLLFRDGLSMQEALRHAKATFSSENAKILMEFVASSKRGTCADVGKNSSEDF